MPPGKRGTSHKKKEAEEPTLATAGATATIDVAGRSKRGRASFGGKEPAAPGAADALDTTGRRSARHGTEHSTEASAEGVGEGIEAVMTNSSRGEMERLGQRLAQIVAEENFLQLGGNLLDLGAPSGGGAPAPTLRGAAAASAAAKAARLAAQGIVCEWHEARTWFYPNRNSQCRGHEVHNHPRFRDSVGHAATRCSDSHPRCAHHLRERFAPRAARAGRSRPRPCCLCGGSFYEPRASGDTDT